MSLQPFIVAHATGEVVEPVITSIEELQPEEPGTARFEVACSCGEHTIVHVPGTAGLAGDRGAFTCGCGFRHVVAVRPIIKETPP